MKSCKHRGLAIPRILRASGIASLAAGVVLIPINIAWASSGQMVGFVPADAYDGMMTVLPILNLILIGWAVVASLLARSMLRKVHELEYEVDHLRQLARLTARESMVAPAAPIGQREHAGASVQVVQARAATETAAASDSTLSAYASSALHADGHDEGFAAPRGKHSAPEGAFPATVVPKDESLRRGAMPDATVTDEPGSVLDVAPGEGIADVSSNEDEAGAGHDASPEAAADSAADLAAYELCESMLALEDAASSDGEEPQGVRGSAFPGCEAGGDEAAAEVRAPESDALDADETPAWLRADDPSISGMISQLEDEMGVSEGYRMRNDEARRAGAFDRPQAKAGDDVRRIGRQLAGETDRQAALRTLDEEPEKPVEPSWYSARELEQIERRAAGSAFDPLAPQTAEAAHRREELDRGLRTGKIVPIADARTHLTGQLEPVTGAAIAQAHDGGDDPADSRGLPDAADDSVAGSPSGAEDAEDAFPALSAASVVDEMIAELSHVHEARKAN